MGAMERLCLQLNPPVTLYCLSHREQFEGVGRGSWGIETQIHAGFPGRDGDKSGGKGTVRRDGPGSWFKPRSHLGFLRGV